MIPRGALSPPTTLSAHRPLRCARLSLRALLFPSSDRLFLFGEWHPLENGRRLAHGDWLQVGVKGGWVQGAVGLG